MLPGYNHNIAVSGTTFHVQTEDRSGESPYIETQVFVGGAIVHVKKTPYQFPDEGQIKRDAVILIMQDQHKSVLKLLSQKRLPGMERYLNND